MTQIYRSFLENTIDRFHFGGSCTEEASCQHAEYTRRDVAVDRKVALSRRTNVGCAVYSDAPSGRPSPRRAPRTPHPSSSCTAPWRPPAVWASRTAWWTWSRPGTQCGRPVRTFFCIYFLLFRFFCVFRFWQKLHGFFCRFLPGFFFFMLPPLSPAVCVALRPPGKCDM